MAALILPSRRVVQPQGAVEIDPKTGLTPVGLFVGSCGPFNLANGRALTTRANTSFRASAAGMGSVQKSVDTGLTQALSGYAKSGELVAIWHGIPTAAPTGSTPVFVSINDSTTSQSIGPIGIEYTSSTQLSVNFGPGAVRSGTFDWTTVTGKLVTMVASASETTQRARLLVCFDGKVVTVVDSTLSSFAPGNPTGTEHFVVGPDIVEQPTRVLNADVALAGVFKGQLSGAEAARIGLNPWQLFRPIQRRIIVDMGAGGGAVDLVTQAASHAQIAESVALTTATALVANSATHAHSAESVLLATSTALSLADASHAQAADNPTLATTTLVDLAVVDASHAHAADSVALLVASVLTISDAEHAHSADSVGLTTVEALTIASAEHAHSAENITLTIGGIGLAVADAAHAQAADVPTFSVDSFLITADASHGHTADLLTLSTAVFFAVDDAVHAQTADNLSLDGAPTLQVEASEHAHTAETVALTMDSWLEAANAAHAHTAQNITLSVVADAEPLTNEEMRELLESVRILRIQLQAVNGYTSLIPALL